MLKIRLRRPGKSAKGRYHYKIVVAEAKSARESKFAAQIGYYDPSHNLLKIDIEKYETWIKKGAQPTETMATLFRRYKRQNKKAAVEAEAGVETETKAKEETETKAETKAEEEVKTETEKS